MGDVSPNPIRPGPSLTSSFWSKTAGYLPDTHSVLGTLPLSHLQSFVSFPKLQRRVPNIQTFWNPGEEDEIVDDPSFGFRDNRTNLQLSEVSQSLGLDYNQRLLAPRAKTCFLLGSS